MGRAINIIGIVLSVVLIVVSAYYVDSASSSWWREYGPSRADWTIEGGLITLLFILFFVAMNLINLISVKTMTSKVMSIIGLSLTGIALFFNVIMLLEPRSASYDEVGILFFLYAFIALAFAIVGLVQAVIYLKRGHQQKQGLDEMVIDDL